MASKFDSMKVAELRTIAKEKYQLKSITGLKKKELVELLEMVEKKIVQQELNQNPVQERKYKWIK